MRLIVTTPMSVIVDTGDVRHIHAEDETGAFGILAGHADFITVLAVSVVTWRDNRDVEHHVAVRGGVLTVSGGDLVEIATRAAVSENILSRLGSAVLERFQEEAEEEEASKTSSTRLNLAAIRQVQRYLQAESQPNPLGAPASFDAPKARGGVPEGGELS